MFLSCCLVLAIGLGTVAVANAQTSAPPPAVEQAASPFAGDERAAKLAERYRIMLAANPVEGAALDRLWKFWEDHHAIPTLIADYDSEARRTGTSPAWLVYGHLLKRAGRFDDAAAAYEQAGKADPGGFLPMLARADLATVRHQPEAAAPLYAEAVAKLAPNDPRAGEVLMKLGNAWLAAGQPARAAESWEQIVAANPANLALHKQLAEIYAHNHLAGRALAHYDYIVQHADPPARAATLREVGRLHESRGEFDAARDAFEQGLALTSRDNWLNDELQGALIRLFQRAGRVSELEARWRRAAEQTPRDLGGLLRLETLAEAQGDAQSQREWLEKMVVLAPRDRDSRLKLARLLVGAGEREKAAAAYDQLLGDQPDQLDLLLARADLDVQLGNPPAAIRRLETRLAKNPTDETIAAPIQDFYLRHHLDEPAERHLRTAKERQPAALEPGVALANFYFARRRVEEARRVLSDLGNQAGTVAVRSDRWQRFAAIYKDENLPEDAWRCWQEVEKLSPRAVAPKLALADWRLAHSDARSAADALQKAAGMIPDGAEREEVERKLFDVLSAGFNKAAAKPEDEGSTESGPRRRSAAALGPMAFAPGRAQVPTVIPGGPLDDYLNGLEEEAARQPSAAGLLRLARWQVWAHLPTEAVASAGKALSLEPRSIPAHLLLANLAADARRHDVALKHWRKLIVLDPARKPAYLREVAGLQMDTGDFDAALAVYTELQEQQPGAVEPLTDLASAEQRADRWFDALATWKRAYQLPSLPPAQRAEVRRPLIAAYDHLGEARPAADLLMAAVDDQRDPGRKQETFHELNDFCRRHALAAWLGDQYEARLQTQPDDYFTMLAVAEIRRGNGQEFEAYQLMSQAFYSAPEPTAALKGLAEEAEAVGEDEQAVSHRRRLVSMPGQNTPENLEKLTLLEEGNLDVEAAGRTWERIVALYPRDTGALAHAAEFFERTGQPERARRLLAQVASIDPGDLTRIFHLGKLAHEAGDLEGARVNFETVLARSSPEERGDPLRFPAELETAEPAHRAGFGTLTYRPHPTDAPSKTGDEDRALRLQAIRGLAQLLPEPAPAPGKRQLDAANPRGLWLERWRAAAAAGARSEPLEALYSSGEAGAVMDLLAGWMTQEPASERLRAAYLGAGLRLGEYARLARWAWPEDGTGEPVLRGPLLVEALQQFLADGGKPTDEMASGLFPPHVKARDLLWKAARECFAERRWLQPAAELGERVCALAPNGRAAYAVETAQWELCLGRADRARAILRDAIHEGGGVFYDGIGGSPAFEALRVYYLLLPVGERSAFVDAYLREWRESGEPIQEVLSAVVLRGLQGDEEKARRALDALLALRLIGRDASETTDVRRWTYVLAAGTQLQGWNLGSLAAYLWRKALQEATAFDRQNSDAQKILADIRGRLVTLEVAATDPETAREHVASYLRGEPSVGAITAVASQQMAASQFLAARQFYEYLTRLEPNDGDYWRNLLAACDALGDTDAMERILALLLDGARLLPPALNRAELVRQLATLHQTSGDGPGAIRLLEHEYQNGTQSAPVVTTLALEYERIGRLDDAIRVWQDGVAADPGNARNYRLALARLEEGRGNFAKAISLLEAELVASPATNRDEQQIRLTSLYLKVGRLDDAKKLALAVLRTKDYESLVGIARVFSQAGQPALARGWLVTAVRRSKEPQAQFQLQRELLQPKPKPNDLPLADFVRDIRRLGKIAQASPTLKNAYAASRYELARQRGADDWLRGELEREWRGGQGDFAAGEGLAGLYADLRQAEPLRQVVASIDRRPNLPEQSLQGLQKRLTEAGFASLALPISERLCRRFPQNETYVIGRARTLWKSGEPTEANQLLEDLDLTSVFREDLSIQIAALYQDLREPTRASDFLCGAVQRDPTATRSLTAYLRLAEAATQRKNWSEVRRLLLAVYRRSSAAVDLRPLATYLWASGRWKDEIAAMIPGREFTLTYQQRGQLVAMLYQQLQGSGQSAQAQTLLTAYPRFLGGSAALTEAMRAGTDPTRIPAYVAALEQANAEAEPPVPRLRRELAAQYVRWSDQESNRGSEGFTERMTHLARANQLTPEDFAVAQRLATLCWESAQPARAVRALQPFLAADAVPAERDQARQLLAGH